MSQRIAASLAEPWRQQLFAEAFASTAVGVVLTQPDGRIIVVNHAFARLAGYDGAESMMAEVGNVAELYARADDRPMLIDRLMKEGTLRDVPLDIRTRDGGARSLSVQLSTVRDAEGRAIGFQASALDRSEARRAEQRAALEALRLRRLVELLPVAVWMLDDGGKVLLRNRAAEQLWATAVPEGLERFERYRGWWADTGEPIAPPQWPIRRALSHGETHVGREIEIETPAGQRRVVRNSTAPIRDDAGAVIGALAVNEDITDLKRHQRELQEAVERFGFVTRATNDAVWDWNLRDDSVWWNDGYESLFGHSPAQRHADVRSWTDFIHPDDSERVVSSIHAAMDGGGQAWSAEYRFRRADGSYADVFDRGFVVRDGHGAPLRMIGAMMDISARKASERALQESEARFRSLVRLSSDWYWVQDEEFRFTHFERGADERSGVSVSRVLGKTRWEIEGAVPLSTSWEAHRAMLEAHRPFRGWEYYRVGDDGELRYAEVSGEPVFDAEGAFRGYRGLGKDITERKRAQRESEMIGRLFAALSGVNELVSRARTAEELLRGACEVAVASGDFQFALVRLVDPDEENASMVALAGREQVPWLNRALSLDPASPDAEALPIVAMRTGRPALATGERLTGRALFGRLGETGTRAAGAYPLRRGGRCVGALLLNSRDPHAFVGEMGALLERLAASVSRGLDALDAEEALQRFRFAIDHSADMVVLIDRATLRLVDVNQSLCRLLGYTREELLAMSAEQVLTMPREEIQRAYDELIADPEGTGQVRSQYRCKDGTLVPFESTRRAVLSGGRWVIIAVSRDIRAAVAAEQARREAEWALATSEEMMRGILHAAAGPLLLTDIEGTILYANPAAGELFGRPLDALHGMPFGVPLAGSRPTELELMDPAGKQRTVEMRVARATLPAGPSLVVSLHDMTERKDYERHIEHLANHDGLTGLPNRTLLRDRVEQAIVHSRRGGGHVALMFVDLDRFKLINDSWGHVVGDALLLEVGRILKQATRDGDTVARLGGDEFVLLLSDLTRPGDAAVVARKIAAALDHTIVLDGRELRPTASIGISVCPADGEDLDTLLQCADAAMYRAKDAGRNGYQFYSAEMGTAARARVETENGLRAALERNELRLHYQPQVDLRTGRIFGFEALLRWEHPTRGLVSPASFIPVAEESGLIVPIGEWALREACREAAGWSAAGLGALKVSVNLSARQFWRGGVPDAVRAALAESALPAAQLEVEITESVVARDLKQVMHSLEQLRRMGVTVAIDDFGTGYSSLAYLRSLPIDKLKIDKGFIDGIPADGAASALVVEIVRLAHALSLGVVAEGVETLPQATYLRGAGCEGMQGYLFSRPLPGSQCAVLLRSGRRLELGGGEEVLA